MQTDFLVIGSGIAGLRYALEVAEHGAVTVITKKHSAESNTSYAQGGIAAVMSPEDNFAEHIADTLACGAGLCDEEVVTQVVQEGPACVRDLLALGARFTRQDGGYHLGKEGGHSTHRIIHAADATGREIERVLLAAVQKHPNITLLEYHYVYDLMLQEGQCTGAWLLDEKTGASTAITARVTLLATGGSGQVYRHTTNPAIATGDGVAMAWRAGAKITNMEFFQFHPTVLYRADGKRFLISEAVRGAGAKLSTQDGHYFMPEYDERAELAPRDVVARAIHDQLQKRGEDYVHLDISHLAAAQIREEFPTIYQTCQQFGIDITQKPMPVVPAAHYQCGGVYTNLQAETTIPGLLACGEVAYTGLHGANRLASNSLLEALVFSHRAAKTAKELAGSTEVIVSHETFMEKAQAEECNIAQKVQEVQTIMSHHAGIVRSRAGLAEAIAQLQPLAQKIEAMIAGQRATVALYELRNLLAVALLILSSAHKRQESRGLHFMQEIPEVKPEFSHPTYLQKGVAESAIA
jgi:L-aspartate oxidase